MKSGRNYPPCFLQEIFMAVNSVHTYKYDNCCYSKSLKVLLLMPLRDTNSVFYI